MLSNQFPSRTSTRRIAIIHESPGYAEFGSGKPFSGAANQLLSAFLSHAGIDLEACYMGYVCPVPFESRYRWDGPELKGGVTQLTDDLAKFQPHLCILLGNLALSAFAGESRKLDDWRGYVWRATHVCPGVKCIGMLRPEVILKDFSLTGEQRFYMRRAAKEALTDELVIPERLVHWNLNKDELIGWMRRIRETQCPVAIDIEGGCGMGPACVGFAVSAREAVVVPFYGVDGCSIWSEEDEVELWEAVAEVLEDASVPKIVQNAAYELFVLAWSMGIVVRGIRDDTMCKHFELYCELDKALEFQAAIYTQQPFWKLEHKLVGSYYAPFKGHRRATTEEWMIYNGTDCCVTYEVNEVMDGMLKPKQREHYQFNVSLLAPFAYMSLRGMRYDKAKAQARLQEVQQRIYEKQDEINQEACRGEGCAKLKELYAALEAIEGGASIRRLVPSLAHAFCKANPKEKREVEEIAWQPMHWNGKKWVKAGKRLTNLKDCETVFEWQGETEPPEHVKVCTQTPIWLKLVRKLVTRSLPVEISTFSALRRFAKTGSRGALRRVCHLLKICRRQSADGFSISPAQRGELSVILELQVNTESTQKGGAAQWFLYEHCGFDKQFKKEGGRKTDKLTTDTEALLNIYTKTKDPRCKLMLDLRALLTASEMLAKEPDEDGRIRTSYNIVGTNTGRVSSSESNTGSGFNLQTVTKSNKDLFLADEGMELYSCDLSGADSWTVAAHCAALGDRNMLDDLLNKLKPAKITALMQMHGVSVNSLSRDQLKIMSKDVPEEGGLYPACKAVSHGSNYGAKAPTVSSTLLKQSYKKTGVAIVVSKKECDQLQGYYFTRYEGVKRWQQAVLYKLRDCGTIPTPFGYSRRFFGRKDDPATLRDALAFEPQAITTWATNMMLLKLWSDLENRREDGSLWVEPLHQVHDATVFQGPAEKRDWVVGKGAQWFNNPICIAGVEVLIPYGLSVGRDWRTQE